MSLAVNERVNIFIKTFFDNKGAKEAKKELASFQQIMGGLPTPEFASARQQAEDKAQARAEASQKATNKRMDKFRMKLLFFGLATMFAGMALQKATQGLIQPAAEAVGIFDIWSSILTILFLPIMMVALGVFIWMLEEVSKMSEEMKMFIGFIVVAGFVLGSLMIVIGQIASFTAGFTLLTGAVEGFAIALGVGGTGGLLAAVVALAGPLAVVVALLVLMAATAALIEPPPGVEKNDAEKWADENLGPAGWLASDMATFVRLGISKMQDAVGLSPSYPGLLDAHNAAVQDETLGWNQNDNSQNLNLGSMTVNNNNPTQPMTKEDWLRAAIAANE